MDVFDILTITKTAGMSGQALHAAHVVSDDAIALARNLAKHFKVAPADNDFLFMARMREVSKPRLFSTPLTINLIPNNVHMVPNFDIVSNAVTTYKEPWSYMHEFAHADNRKDLLKTIQSLISRKTKLSTEERALIENYITKYYKSGNRHSIAAGDEIMTLVNGAMGRPKRETMPFIEEIRASAKAINDTERLHSPVLADKVFQPTSVLDASTVKWWKTQQ